MSLHDRIADSIGWIGFYFFFYAAVPLLFASYWRHL